MPRPSDVTASDPGVPVHGVTLDWLCRRAGYSQEELARRVSERLNQRARRRVNLPLPHSVTGAAIHQWRKGKRKTCRLSVLTAMADELGVTPDYLRADREPRHLQMGVRFARSRPRRGNQSVPNQDLSRLATCWFHLPAWRALFLEKQGAPASGNLEEPPPIKHSELVNFADHMLEALRIILAPLAHGAASREQGSQALLDFVRREGNIDPLAWPVRYTWSP